VRVKTSTTIIEKAKAGYSGLYIVTQEPTRTIGDILTASADPTMKRRVLIWTLGKGLWEEFADNRPPERMNKVVSGSGEPADLADAMYSDVLELIPQTLRKHTAAELEEMTSAQRRQAQRSQGETKALYVLNNFHHFIDDPMAQAKILEIVQEFKTQQKILILLSPVLRLPVEIEKEFALVETPLPDKDDLAPILDAVMAGVRGDSQVQIDEARKHKLLESALGLTTQEAENAFALSYVRPKQGSRPTEVWDPAVVMEEKCSTLRKSGLLEFYPPIIAGMNAIGGMQGLKDWVNRRKRAFTEEARAFGLPPPKGILLVGVAGTGKSLGAKATAAELGLPLLRCDMGRIYAGLVGASEANIRAVIRIAEAVAPCVLWFDEIEKGLAGAMQSSGDSGVGSRILGSLLTWMQEKTSDVFVYATANKISILPPELVRKGRFDEIFGVDLPSFEELKEIWRVQLRNFKREALILGPSEVNPAKIDIEHFAKASDGYSGAEIEAVIKEALFAAFSSNRELNSVDLQDALDSTIPLKDTMRDQVEEIRKWVKGRARPANLPDAVREQVMSNPMGGRVLEA
jgi:hypothetical protein